jgi:quercetin dioxygenase-like cupin family protein
MAQSKKRPVNDDLPPISKLIEMVDYQKGSVVSKTLVGQKTETITIFAFAEGQGLSEHTAPFDAVVSILDGETEITISGKSFHLKAGEMMTLPANKPHALKAIKQFKMMLVMTKI